MMRKKLIIFGMLVIILAVVIVVFLADTFQFLKGLQPEPVLLSPMPSQAITFPSGKVVTTPLPPFRVLSVNPPPDPQGVRSYAQTLKVTFVFNREIDPETLKIEVSPSMHLNNQFGQTLKELVIAPESPYFWESDKKYSIIIKKETKAIGGGSLPQDFVYQFTPKFQGGL